MSKLRDSPSVCKMVAQPALSIVVCTRNRSRTIRETLCSYNNIRTQRLWELIVVNNSSTDNTQEVIDCFVNSACIPVNSLFQAKLGVPSAKNLGWRAAGASVVAFTDDDCYLNHDFVDAACNVMERRTLDFCGGRVLLYDPADHPITTLTRPDAFDIPPNTFIRPGLMHGANLLVRKTALTSLGGFNEAFGPGAPLRSGDDVEFMLRASCAGFSGGYDPSIVVYHHHRRRSFEDVKTLRRRYDFGRGAYLINALVMGYGRRQVIQYWYCNSVKTALRSLSDFMKLAQEMRGAFFYCWYRLGRVFSPDGWRRLSKSPRSLPGP